MYLRYHKPQVVGDKHIWVLYPYICIPYELVALIIFIFFRTLIFGSNFRYLEQESEAPIQNQYTEFS